MIKIDVRHDMRAIIVGLENYRKDVVDGATRVFNQIIAGAKNVEKSFDSLKSTGAALVAGFSLDKIIEETVAWEQASIRLNAALKATGNAAGLTRNQLDQMAHSLSEATPFNEKDIREAEANLVKFGNIHDQVFSEALKLSADWAAKEGTSVASASQALGRALQDPVSGLKQLQREFGTLTFTQKQYIEQLEAQGKTEEAQIALLDIIRAKIGGTAAGANTGLIGFLGVLSKAWDQVGEAAALAFAKMQKAGQSGLMASLINSDASMIGPPEPPPPPSWQEGYARQQAQIASAIAKTQEAQDRENEARQKAIPVLRTWMKMLGDQTNEQRALDLVLEGEARLWNDREKAILLNIAAELDWRRVAKERMDLAEREAKALQDFRDGTLSEEENLATRVKTVQDAWAKGTRDTFLDYINHAKDGAEQAAFFFRNAFQNMEDALVNFAMTGKLNFHAFAQSVIADLIRIQVRQQLAGFVSSSGVAGFAGSLGSIFGFGTTAPAFDAVSVHTGGVIGESALPTRRVPASSLYGARRMHSGGLAGDEVPAILQRGETVLPRGMSAGGVAIRQTIHVGGNVSTADIPAILAASRQGTMAAIAEERRRNPGGPFG